MVVVRLRAFKISLSQTKSNNKNIKVIVFMLLLFFRHFFYFPYDNLIIRGDIIKKNIGVIIMALTIALIFSKMMFNSYKSEKVMESMGNIYLLQYGSYVNKEVMEELVKKLDDYVVIQNDNKYYVYLGAYINLETARKLQKTYIEQEIHTYIKNDYLSDTKLINNLKELDNLIINEEDNKKILEINKKILKLLKNSLS